MGAGILTDRPIFFELDQVPFGVPPTRKTNQLARFPHPTMARCNDPEWILQKRSTDGSFISCTQSGEISPLRLRPQYKKVHKPHFQKQQNQKPQEPSPPRASAAPSKPHIDNRHDRRTHGKHPEQPKRQRVPRISLRKTQTCDCSKTHQHTKSHFVGPLPSVLARAVPP